MDDDALHTTHESYGHTGTMNQLTKSVLLSKQ